MSSPAVRTWRTPREQDLGLLRISNNLGLGIAVLPNGSVFAIEHRSNGQSILINQVLASTIGGGIARMLLRVGGPRSATREAVGPRAQVRLGASDNEFVWEGVARRIQHRVTLRILHDKIAWLWNIDVTNVNQIPIQVDSIFLQDLGLGTRPFVTNNEAYASQYIDHHIADDPSLGPVVMSRQNLSQDGRHPWVMHGCLEGAAAFATDAMQVFGPRHRDSSAVRLPFGTNLPNRRLQHEATCVALQSSPITLEPGASTSWRFFALYDPDHSAASDDADLARLREIEWRGSEVVGIATAKARRSVVHDAPSARVVPLAGEHLAQRYPDRLLEEFRDGRLLSFFIPDPPHNRHVVLHVKERLVTRRHGSLLRTGKAMLPDVAILCATCWMHGVFAAQLTIGNTSFHKLFSVSRDPYNIMRQSGLRILVDTGNGWRLLTIPSVFDMGLSECRWIYALSDRVITVHAMTSGEDPAMQWRISVDGGGPCRFLVYGHLVLGERDLEHNAVVMVDSAHRRFTFRPDPESLWGRHYPDASYHLVTSTPEAVEAMGGDELLYPDGVSTNDAYVTIRTLAVRAFCFAVVGSLTDPFEAARLAGKYEASRDDAELRGSATAFWTSVTRGARILGVEADVAALNASLPWLAHDAMIHLTVPRGLEQYTGAAWGTRDVCQGPVEFLLTLEHDEPVKQILRTVFAQQLVRRGDWPQWFMLEPYSSIHDSHSHGDVIVWPLKALNDYLEATDDLPFLEEMAAWRDDETMERTAREDPIAVHVDKLLATIRDRFVRGTHLIRYGEGDWNDSLQPTDPKLRDAMVSSWTVALLYQQLMRYADMLNRAGREDAARTLSGVAMKVREDFNRFLVRDGTVAGYAIFEAGSNAPELLLHPSDTRTGLRYSLLPMTRSVIGGLFTAEQAQHHLRIIREHLLFPDGVRLMDQPIAYHGGIERTFRRVESASFFGREIGLMYVHAHLRYAEAMAVLGEADALWDALEVVNSISVTERVPNATPRQRNAYFSSSDAAFSDRYEAMAMWSRLGAGDIAVDGGWRIYSSGPGLYISVLLRHALGVHRRFGDPIRQPVLPDALGALKLELGSATTGS